jgi:L-galactose dehydrogenase
MDRVQLGRTGLEVSVAGLGCGGHSRLGQSHGATEAESIALVRRALDLGITFIDTARVYGTEEIVGKAIAGRRDEVVLSTKALPSGSGGAPTTAKELRKSVDKSLKRLRTDHIEVFNLHGVSMQLYDHCAGVLVPELRALQTAGKIGFLGITESFIDDPGHAALQRALPDGSWDVVMVGLNLLNPSAVERVLPLTIAGDVGVQVMFAVRRALSQPDALREVVAGLIASGELDASSVDAPDALGFLLEPGGAGSVAEAAYRWCRHQAGVHVVLTGTGSIAHLEENVASINAGPLPEAHLERLASTFGHLASVSGN